MQKLLTVEEGAEKLGIHPETARKWLREGRLSGVKIGRHWRFREADLNKFIANNLVDNAQ